jgi:aspartyl-tRNA(Asn)/glutamyl-tRNA(Gln) amidotransferase subunit B
MYQTFIGLEIHIHLLTETKVFCGCPAAFGDAPNTNVCPVCLGYPGVLPVLNEQAIHMAYLAARALHCDLAKTALFDRKNYFYPDMTKNYQISQFHSPVGRNGYFEIETDGAVKRVGIHDVHLEEDAGKMIHEGGRSLVDYNRAGMSLLEIVTEPDISSPEETEIFIQSFRRLVRHLRVCDGNMEEGSLRCDANVSINKPGLGLGIKTELKNMNSSRFAKRALHYEIKRQGRLLDKGEAVIQETRLWDEAEGVTKSMRTKESAHDYRYFPEPDLPPFVPDEAFMKAVEDALTELPLTRKNRFIAEHGIKAEFAEIIADERDAADYFEEAVRLGGDAAQVANMMCGLVQARLKRLDIENVQTSALSPARLVSLLNLLSKNVIGAARAKEVIDFVLTEDKDPDVVVKEKSLAQINDASAVQAWVDEVIKENPDPVRQLKEGNMKTLGFLVGQVMKRAAGRADPKEVNRLIKERIQSNAAQ